MAGNALIGNLAVTLSMDTAAFQRGATIAEKRAERMRGKFAATGKSIAGIGAALGAGILVSGLTNAARGAFEMASALSETAEKAGLSVEALQELRFAAQQNGVSNELLETSIARLNKSLGDLQLGEKGAVRAFQQIGIAAADLKNKSPDEALRIIADRLNAIPDAATRVAIGQDIMGRGFSKLLPLINGGSKALDDYATQARESGIITAEEARTLDEAADAWDRTKLKIQVATAKVIAWFATIEKGIYTWYKFRDEVLKSVGDTVGGVEQHLNRLKNILAGVLAPITTVTNAFRSMYDKVVGNSYVPDMVDGIGAEMARLDAVMVQPITAATTKAAEAFRELQAQTSDLLNRLFPEAAELNEFRQELATLEAAMRKGILTAEQYAEALRRLQTEGLTDEGIGVLDQGSLVPGDEDVLAGLESKMGQVVDRSKDWQNVISQVATDLANIGGDFLSRLVEGSVKLKDLWRTVLSYAIQFFTSSNSPFMSLFGGARAMGGPVQRGRTYLVGEEGPELFTANASGQIISNDNLRGASGGNVWNIYTNDADSFRRSQRQIAREQRRRLGVA